jgi:hypothetical protein
MQLALTLEGRARQHLHSIVPIRPQSSVKSISAINFFYRAELRTIALLHAWFEKRKLGQDLVIHLATLKAFSGP